MMQIVIDIPNDIYERIKYHNPNRESSNSFEVIMTAIYDGTPLPKGHGRLIDANDTLQRHCVELCKHKPSCEDNCIIYDLLHLAPMVLESDKEIKE